jgi:hypothetical protein
MGIEQLVDSFMGNPAPLKAKVDRDNANQPPNVIPKDLEEAIALQEIAKIRTGAQNDQAMQAGGAQPSVVERLKQMLASAEQRNQAQMSQGMPQGMPPQMPRAMPQQMPRSMPPQGMPPQMPRGMPQQPVMAAHGGSLNHLMSNLGRNYDGGGIVAFAPGGEIKMDTDFIRFLKGMGSDYIDYVDSSPEYKNHIKDMYKDFKAAAPAAAEVAPAAAAAEGRGLMYGTGKLAGRAVKAAGLPGALASAVGEFGDYKLKSDDDIDTSASGTYSDLKKGELGRAAKGLGMGLGELGADLGSSVANTLDYVVPGKAPVSSAYDKLLRDSGLFKDKPSSLTKEEVSAGDAETEKLKRLAAARVQTGQNTNPALQPRPSVAVVKPSGPPGPPKPVVTKPEIEKETKPEEMDPMETALRAAIMKSLGRDEEQEFQKGAKRQEDFMGLDKLLAPREARIAEREGMQRKIQGERLPDWVAGFDRASKPIVSGGIGTILNNMGSGTEGQRRANSAEDLKFFDDISDMKDQVVKLKLEGKYKAAAAGEAAIKDMLADKRQNESSGTSLLNTKAINKSREQTALDNRLSREQVALEGRLTRTQASNAQLEAKKDERLQKQRNWVAEQERKWQDTLSRNPDYKKAISMRSMQEQILMASTDPAVQDKAQANIDNLNEKIQKMLPTAGAVNIPPPPKGAVVRTG